MKLFALLMLVSTNAFAGSNNRFSTSPFAIIVKGNEMSCYSRSLSDHPTEDIRSDYFALPLFSVGRKDASKDFVLSYIRVSAKIPTMSDTYTCTYSGAHLRALNPHWFDRSEAILPAGVRSLSTDCPIYCGSINTKGQSFSVNGTVEVGGFERDRHGNKTSVHMSAPITIRN